MISSETLRQYPFFGKISEEQIAVLISAAREEIKEKGQLVCAIGEKLDNFFLVLDGNLEILFELPHLDVDYFSTGQPTQLNTELVIIGHLGPGDICGWSGLVPPFISTSSVRASTKCKIIAFDCSILLKAFENDCNLGFYMIQAAAQAIGKRLQIIYNQ